MTVLVFDSELMQFERVGVILNVEHYAECVAFYRDVLELKVMHEKSQGDFRLTCFAMGDSYLMVETGGHAVPGEKRIDQSPHKLRFNVKDPEQVEQALNQKGLDVATEVHDWGRTINFWDPDGNRIGIRDEVGFEG